MTEKTSRSQSVRDVRPLSVRPRSSEPISMPRSIGDSHGRREFLSNLVGGEEGKSRMEFLIRIGPKSILVIVPEECSQFNLQLNLTQPSHQVRSGYHCPPRQSWKFLVRTSSDNPAFPQTASSSPPPLKFGDKEWLNQPWSDETSHFEPSTVINRLKVGLRILRLILWAFSLLSFLALPDRREPVIEFAHRIACSIKEYFRSMHYRYQASEIHPSSVDALSRLSKRGGDRYGEFDTGRCLAGASLLRVLREPTEMPYPKIKISITPPSIFELLVGELPSTSRLKSPSIVNFEYLLYLLELRKMHYPEIKIWHPPSRFFAMTEMTGMRWIITEASLLNFQADCIRDVGVG
ncbi:hypothetical protein C8R46DRAFT_1047383 [Mycena filopes]|nr:hypothetical protein C8R46DRAFT_1047383 [Mycena filopes]